MSSMTSIQGADVILHFPGKTQEQVCVTCLLLTLQLSSCHENQHSWVFLDVFSQKFPTSSLLQTSSESLWSSLSALAKQWLNYLVPIFCIGYFSNWHGQIPSKNKFAGSRIYLTHVWRDTPPPRWRRHGGGWLYERWAWSWASSAVQRSGEGMAVNGFMEDECAGRDKSSHVLAEQEAELFR